MADVLSVLRELRSLEQKKEVGPLTPAEIARLAELQSTLSARFPPIAAPRTPSPDAPFVDTVSEEEPSESPTGVMARVEPPSDSLPSASPPSYGTPFKTPPPISPPASELSSAPVPPRQRDPMSPVELQQWGQVFAPVPFATPTPVPLAAAEPPPPSSPPVAPAVAPPPWQMTPAAVLSNVPVEGATGFLESEKTAMDHLPLVPPSLPVADPFGAPPLNPGGSTERGAAASWDLAATPPPEVTHPAIAWGIPAVSEPPAEPPIPEATPDVIPDVTVDDAPQVWAPGPAVAAWPTAAPAAPYAQMVEEDAAQDLTAVGGPGASPLGALPFAWPTPPAVAPSVVTHPVPEEPPLEEATPIEEALPIEEAAPLEDAIAIDDAEGVPDVTAPDLPIYALPLAAPITSEDASVERTVISAAVFAPSPLPPAPVAAPPPLPPPRPSIPFPPPRAAEPAPPPPRAIEPPPAAKAPEPAWSGRAAGAAPRVPGESRVVIHTLEGVQKRGTLRDVDLSAPTLDLLLQDGRAEAVPTNTLKVVFFMVPMGQQVPKPQGTPVTVTLQDGRQLEGLSPDYQAGASGFFICPIDQRSRTARIYVYAAAVKEIL